jgi:hypothetical protein
MGEITAVGMAGKGESMTTKKGTMGKVPVLISGRTVLD